MIKKMKDILGNQKVEKAYKFGASVAAMVGSEVIVDQLLTNHISTTNMKLWKKLCVGASIYGIIAVVEHQVSGRLSQLYDDVKDLLDAMEELTKEAGKDDKGSVDCDG